MCALKLFLGEEIQKCSIDSMNWVNVNNAIVSFEQQHANASNSRRTYGLFFVCIYFLLKKKNPCLFIHSLSCGKECVRGSH